MSRRGRIIKKILIILAAACILLLAGYCLQNKKTGTGNDASIRYGLVKDWLQLPDTITLGNPTGLGIDSRQNLFIFHRAGRTWPLLGGMPDSYIQQNTILYINGQTGRLLNSWGANRFIMPHGLTVDKDDNVWVTDVGLHQVFKFSHEGELLLTLGEARVPGNDSAHFNRPTDVAVASDGSCYISDGYRNSRVIKFSAAGQYLLQWGKKGSAPGSFNIPHGICLDTAGHVYVADRENSRVQVFDSTGKFLQQYAQSNFANITAVNFNQEHQKLFTIDDLTYLKIKHRGSDVMAIDSAGTVQTRFGRSGGGYTGPVCWYHDIAVDKAQNIYVGDIKGNRVQKFTLQTVQ